MQLTQQTDYAFRALMYAAINSDRRVNITEIADQYQISRSYLTKVVSKLTRKGYLHSVRGNQGGLYLALKPEEISIGALVRAFEPLTAVECMSRNNKRVITKNCQLKHIINRATESFLQVLDQYTFDNLIQEHALITMFFD